MKSKLFLLTIVLSGLISMGMMSNGAAKTAVSVLNAS